MLFNFRGVIRSYHGCTDFVNIHTSAKSLKEAIKNFKYQGKQILKLVDSAYVSLSGDIFINYNVLQEQVRIDGEETIYDNEVTGFEQKKDKYVFEDELLSREELLYKLYNSSFYDNSNHRIACKTKSDEIEHDGKTYIYDDEEGVYWLDGVRFADDYIVRKEA